MLGRRKHFGSRPTRSSRRHGARLPREPRGAESELDTIAEQLAPANAGGGAKYVARHRSRGKLLVRERIELLLDLDTAFLELCPFAAWGSKFRVGGSVVVGIGVVEGIESMILAHDPTVRGGASNPYTFRKVFRGMAIARENRLPIVNIVESGGADLPTKAEIFVPGGQLFHDLTQHSAAGLPTLALVFGNSTAGGAYIPVAVGQTLVVLEAMKMDHTVASPIDGVQSALPVQVSHQVSTGDMLAVVEAADGGEVAACATEP